MTEFVRETEAAEKKFREKLPELLQEASKKIKPYTLTQHGVTTTYRQITLIEQTMDYGSGLRGYVCKLTPDGIEEIISTYSDLRGWTSDPPRKESYEQFAKKCDSVNLSIVARKLASLGL